MRFLFFFVLAVLALPKSTFAFEPQCFTEYSEISYNGSSPLFVSTQERDDLFFVSENTVVPSREKPLFMRSSLDYNISYSIRGFSESGTLPALVDDISTTQIEITPIMAKDGVSMTLKFESPLKKGSFTPNIDIISQRQPDIEISEDGIDYAQINQTELGNYTFSYLRISFKKVTGASSSIFIRTIRFDSLEQSIYIVTPTHQATVLAYRGWICDMKKLSSLQLQRAVGGQNIMLSQEVQNPIVLTFLPLPKTGKDNDSDSIIDMRDNCPEVSNFDQNDRNYDGKGDACTDDDSDGIVGTIDNCPTVKNTDQKDLNANDLGDACEFDTDADNISDGIDNCIHIKNPDQADLDGDNIGNACDNCKIYNPDQADLDKSLVGDVCEAADEYNKVNDTDKDGILDFSDNCIKIANPDQKDTDKDGNGDTCDNCMLIQNPDQKDENKNLIGDMCDDVDKDSIEGWRDNCPTVNNLDQKDSNNDGNGDACSDMDYDSYYDGSDNCPLVYNKDQKDIDKDGIGNICDNKDNRYLESNRTVFIILFSVITLMFISGIVFFIRKFKL